MVNVFLYISLFVFIIIELLDDEDEVLICLSETLPLLLDYIGGPQHYYLLLGPLEKLCHVEDLSVRDKVCIFII